MPEITQFILAHGISRELLLLLVFIPVLSTIVIITRYILGIKTFGIYAPIILALSYYFAGIKLGLFMTALVIISIIVTYSLVKKVRMHYLARISINYIVLVIVLTSSIVLINSLPVEAQFLEIDKVSPFAIISIASLGDFFIKQYVKKSLATTIRTLSESILVATFGILLIRISAVSNFLVNNLWIVILLIPINLLLGQYSGLRLTELLRFKQITNHADKQSVPQKK